MRRGLWFSVEKYSSRNVKCRYSTSTIFIKRIDLPILCPHSHTNKWDVHRIWFHCLVYIVPKFRKIRTHPNILTNHIEIEWDKICTTSSHLQSMDNMFSKYLQSIKNIYIYYQLLHNPIHHATSTWYQHYQQLSPISTMFM